MKIRKQDQDDLTRDHQWRIDAIADSLRIAQDVAYALGYGAAMDDKQIEIDLLRQELADKRQDIVKVMGALNEIYQMHSEDEHIKKVHDDVVARVLLAQ